MAKMVFDIKKVKQIFLEFLFSYAFKQAKEQILCQLQP